MFFSANITSASEDETLWTKLREGTAFAIMRHAIAPGTGDPDSFDIEDCSTQRNLSNSGRQQASEIGEKIRKHGINRAAIFSSAWCRCRETAELLNIGEVLILSSLNSFFRNSELREPQTYALKEWITNTKIVTPLFLITHNVNIRALTGAFTSQGEIVVVSRNQNGELIVLGTL